MRPDRTNDVVVLSKRKTQGKTFKFDGHQYFIDPDRQMLTWTRLFGRFGPARYYSTFYYKQGIANPLDAPGFGTLIANAERKTNESGEFTEAQFKNIVDYGIPSEELAAIFNPWFYRTIAQQTKDIWEQIQFYLTVGNSLALIYIIYRMSKGG